MHTASAIALGYRAAPAITYCFSAFGHRADDTPRATGIGYGPFGGSERSAPREPGPGPCPGVA